MATPSTDQDSDPSEKEDDFAARMHAEATEYQEGFDEAFKGFDWATVQPSEAELDWFNPRRADGSASSRIGAKKPARQDGPQKEPPSEYLSPKRAGEIVGLHPKVVKRAIDDGELRASKLRNRWRIKQADFDAWIKANQNQDQ